MCVSPRDATLWSFLFPSLSSWQRVSFPFHFCIIPQMFSSGECLALLSEPCPPTFSPELPVLSRVALSSFSPPRATCPAPFDCSYSAAAVHFHQVPALLALHRAAPAKLAAAPLHHLSLGCAKASPTAQQLTAIHGMGCSVTLASRGAKNSAAGIPVAEVWAGHQVDQVMSCVGFETGALGHQELA